MREKNATIHDFINIIPNGYIQKSNRYYFDCPYCESPKEKLDFNVYQYNDTYLFKCFRGSCNVNGNLWQLKEKLNISNSNEYQNIKTKVIKNPPATRKKETKNSKYSLEQKENCISTLFTISSLTSQHKKKFIDKRGFEPTEYYKSYSRFTIKELEKTFDKDLIEECSLYETYLNDRILIFHPDINKNIITYRAYSFTAPAKYKKLPPKNESGLRTIPYRVDLLTSDIKEIIITEGEEKADSVNVLVLKKKAFISIGSINNHNLIINFVLENKEYCIQRNFTILFDKKKETKFSEEIQAYELTKKLIKLGINCHICLMPEIPNCNESDIDSYLKYIVSIGKNPKYEIEKILNRKLNYKDFKKHLIASGNKDVEKHFIASDKKESKDTRFKPNQIWKTPEETNINYDTLENIREKTIDGIKSFIGLDNKNHGTCLVKNPPGTGKSFIMKDISENFGFKIAFLSSTKELRDNTSKEIKGSKVYHSLVDRYKELIEKSNIYLDEEKESIIFAGVNHLINNGYPEKVENYLKKTIQLKEKLDKNYFKESFKSINTLALTHSIFVNHQKSNVDYGEYFDCVVIDESITNLLKGKIKLIINDLNRFKIYLKNKEIKDFLELIIEFMKTSKECSSSCLYFNFTEFLEIKNIDIGNLKSKLKKSTISFDRKKIDKELFNDNLELSSLPNKNELEIFIKEFTENNFNNVNALKGFNDTLELSINYFNKINYGNKKDEKLIILDATADKEILKCFGFNVVKEIEFNIKSDNLEVIQDFSHTFTTSSQKDKDGNFNDKYIDVYKNLADENTFLLTPKETRLNLETLDLPCSFGNYQRDDKATNKYKDCSNAIITPPKSNDEVNFDEVKMLRPDINNFETRKVYVGTGFINEEGLELFNEEIEFIEPFINRVVEQTKQVLMVQGLSRIRRDFTTNKTVIILGNISLKKYGIIPNETKNFLEENKPSNKIYDFFNTELSNFFSKNEVLLNKDLDSYLLSNVTRENKNKVITLTDSTIQGFEDKNKAQTLTITMFVLNSIKDIVRNCHKHNYYLDTIVLPDFTKNIKDRLIKSFDLKKSFFDLDNKRHYFYYKSTSDIKDIKAKINFELNLTAPAPAIPENNIIKNINGLEKIDNIDLEQHSITKDYYENIPEEIFLKAKNNFELFKDTRINAKDYINFDYICSIDKWQGEDGLSSNKRIYRELFFEKLMNEHKEINRIIDKKILSKSVFYFLNNIETEITKCHNDIIEYNKFEKNDESKIKFEIDFEFLEKYLIDCRFNLCVRLTYLDNDFNNSHKLYSNLDFWHFFTDYIKGCNGNKNRSYESLILYLYTYYRLNYENTEQPKNTISLD